MSPAAVRRELEAALIAILVALAAGSLLMIVAGVSPLDGWRTMAVRTFGNAYGLGQVIYRMTPLVLTGLAVAVPLRAGLFNIGGEGQMVAAALVCAVVAAAIPAGTPAVIAVPLGLAAAAAAGAGVGAATGALRAYRGAHEVIAAIMLNAIIAGVALWLGNTWLFTGESTSSAAVVAGARLPSLGITGSGASASLAVAVVAAAGCAWLFGRTVTGFRWRMVGAGPDAARASGLDVARAQVSAMAVAGAMAGLAGAHFVLADEHAYQDGLGRGQGFLGVAVALLAGGRPAALVASAFVFGALAQGGLEVLELVPKEIVDVLQAIVVMVAAVTLGRRPR